MAKKKYNVQDAVGDTSGFNDTPHSSSKKRKITLFIGLGGIVALIVICCIILTTPVKIEFKYNDLSKQSERYQVNKSTGLITNAPSDPTKKFYEFGGWYLNSSYTIGPLFNNDENKSLLEYKFSTRRNSTLYARWKIKEYKIEYDVVGNASFNSQIEEMLQKINNNKNLSSYTYQHELTEADRNEYVENLRIEDPEKYVNSPNAAANIEEALEKYAKEAPLNSIEIKAISLEEINKNGWTFEGWVDEDGKIVTSLDKHSPKDVKLTARWKKN